MAADLSSKAPATIWQQGLVIGAGDGLVRVRFERLRQCQRCLEGQGCGAGVFSRLFSSQAAEIALPDRQDFAIGQVVRVGIRAHEVVKLAIIVYLLPILAFILGAALTASLLTDSLAQDLIGLAAGFVAGCGAAYLGSRYGGGVLNPHLEMLSASARCAAFESSPVAD